MKSRGSLVRFAALLIALAGGGAVLGAGARAVFFEPTHATVAATPGARAADPCPTTIDELDEDVERMHDVLKTARAAPCPDLAKERARIEQLRADVAAHTAQARDRDARLSEANRSRAARLDEGALRVAKATLEAPADLPARYRPEALRAALEAALAHAGINASLPMAECGRIPCEVGAILHGTANLEAKLAAMRRDEAFAPYLGDAPTYGALIVPPGAPDPGVPETVTFRFIPSELVAALAEARASDPPVTDADPGDTIAPISFAGLIR